MAKIEIPDEIIDRVQDVYRQEGYRSVRDFVTDVVRRRADELQGHPSPLEPDREELLQKARAIVPQSDEREHVHTGEPFIADTDMETRFVAMVIETQGQNAPNRAQYWSTDKFLLPPDERDQTMEQWTASMYRAGKVSLTDLERWNLPTDWIGSQGGDSNAALDDYE